MSIEKHHLHHEFPEYDQQIHDLKMNDRHFARLFEEYDVIDKEVYRIEEEIEAASDQRLEDLKIKRVHLKDELYQMLQKAAS